MPDSIDRARDALEAAEDALAAAEDAGANPDTLAELAADADTAEAAYFRAVDSYARV